MKKSALKLYKDKLRRRESQTLHLVWAFHLGGPRFGEEADTFIDAHDGSFRFHAQTDLDARAW